MPTTVLFPSPRLGRLTVYLTMDSSASLTGSHVVRLYKTELENGTFPDEMGAVPPVGSATSLYRNRGDDGTVNLNRLNTGVMSPTGLFCCVVPDASGIIQGVCATISE